MLYRVYRSSCIAVACSSLQYNGSYSMLVRIATSTAVMVQQVRGTHYVPVPSVCA
jgi:hypothetical protein